MTGLRVAWLDRARALPLAEIAALVLAGALIALLPLSWAVVVLLAALALALSLVRPQLGLLLVVPAVPFGSLREVQIGPLAVGVTEGLVALVVAAWILRMLVHREVRIRRQPLTLALLILLSVMLLSLVRVTSLELGAKEIIKWVEVLLVYLFVSQELTGRWRRALVFVLLGTGAVVALQGIYQFLFRVGPEAFLLFDRFMRAYGTFAQPNPYGAYLGLTLPVAAGLAIALRLRRGGAREWPLLVLSVVSGVLMAIALVMSWSRGAWLGFAAAVVAMALAMVVRSRWAAPWLAIGLAGVGYLALAGGVAYLPPALVQRFSDLTPFLSVSDVRGVEITDANYAVVERLAHWQAATAMWADRPWLGVGIGNYSVAYPAYALPLWPDPLGHAHNYYLNTGAETGILGLLAYVAFVGVALLLTWREAMRSTGWRWGLVLGALGVLVHLSVHSLFDNLYVHALYLQVAILLGAVASNGREQEPA